MPATMDSPNTTAAETGGSITNLISGILDDGKTLARQQMEMFKSEVREDLRKTLQGAQYGGLGMVALVIGALALINGLVWLLHEQAGLKMWISFGIVGLGFLGIGAGLALASNRIFKSFNPLPDKTLTAAQENLTWTKN